MNRDQRINLYKHSLEEAIRRDEKIVIFEDPSTGLFVQFAVEAQDNEIIVDIPINELNKTTYEWLRPQMEPMTDTEGELLSLQKTIKSENTQYAAEYTEYLFTKIFQLPENHDVTEEIFS
ncbi:hypothetical protein GF326_06470 [Candidatus Bathyarchaeota archaeon]|nr:hypothetical protein [Candidatus Bathyarchaeota archaeon]